MIGRLLHGAIALFACFCVATVIAEAIIAGLLVFRWHFDGDRFAKTLLAAKGELPTAESPPPEKPKEPSSSEQISFDQILEARVVKEKDLQLREQALASSLAQLGLDQRKLVDEESRYKKQRTDYEKKLAAALDAAKTTGVENARRILQTLKPTQSKEFLIGMLNNRQLSDVVTLLSEMPDAKRAKILSEFKSPEETKKAESIFDMIRRGSPEGPLADQAKEQLASPTPQTPSS
jgi:hypothetical protein